MRSDRSSPLGQSEATVLPVVAKGRRGLPLWVILAIAALGAVLLFLILDGQRRANLAPAVEVGALDRVDLPASLPPLRLDDPYQDLLPPPPPPSPPAALLIPQTLSRPVIVALPPSPAAPATFSPATSRAPPLVPVQQTTPASTTSSASVLVIDTTAGPGGRRGTSVTSDGQETTEQASLPTSTAAVRSTLLRRRSTTVAQGTLIPAVLETALDSTRPGLVRAVVSRDVKGFDGTEVLIPRGSRLFGTYETDLTAGQNRALVQWTRLVRPDGVSIALDSPAADTVGRTGIRGRVDNHFLQRFASAALQTTMNIGLNLANRSVGSDTSVIVALPNAVQSSNVAGAGQAIQPTLRVEAGVTVTAFVARDLELTPIRPRP